jgi:hypothetical protein
MCANIIKDAAVVSCRKCCIEGQLPRFFIENELNVLSVWSVGVIKLQVELKSSDKILFQWHFIHKKTRLERPAIVAETPRLEVCDGKPE